MARKQRNSHDYEADKRRVDRFEEQIKRICASLFISTAPPVIDRTQATDLLVIQIKPVNIACRVRRHDYFRLGIYRYEFTIRTSRPSGAKTELEKILDGWCDYNFYGFADAADEKIMAWIIGDLAVFRREWARAWEMKAKHLKERHISWREKKNADGSSEFCAFDWRTFPGDFMVASGRDEEADPTGRPKQLSFNLSQTRRR